MFSYNNIGGKIKRWAQWLFILEAIAAAITGIILMAADDDLILAGLLVLLLGPFVGWVSSWLLYGYGQLIENSDIIATQYKRINAKVTAEDTARAQTRIAEQRAQQREAVKATIAALDTDGEDPFIDITCLNCQAELSFSKEQLQEGGELICPICDAPINL